MNNTNLGDVHGTADKLPVVADAPITIDKTTNHGVC